MNLLALQQESRYLERQVAARRIPALTALQSPLTSRNANTGFYGFENRGEQPARLLNWKAPAYEQTMTVVASKTSSFIP